MLWVTGPLSVVLAIYLSALYWARATKANKSGAQWGLGALVAYLVVMGVIDALIRLIGSPLGVPYYMQIWIDVVAWFVFTIYAGIKTDSIFAQKLPVAQAS